MDWITWIFLISKLIAIVLNSCCILSLVSVMLRVSSLRWDTPSNRNNSICNVLVGSHSLRGGWWFCWGQPFVSAHPKCSQVGSFFFAGMGGCGLCLLSRNGWFIYFNCVLQFGLFPKHVFCSLVHLTSLKLFSNCFGSWQLYNHNHWVTIKTNEKSNKISMYN